MGDLIMEEAAPRLEAQNQLAVILCRGAGKCDLDFSQQPVRDEWSKRIICTHHYEVFI